MNTFGVIGTLGLAIACLPAVAFGMGGSSSSAPGQGDGHSETSRIPEYHKSGASPAPSAAAAAVAKPSAQDMQFVNEAAKGGMMEVAGGKVASKNSTNGDVKGFGNRMVSDHSKANNQLKAIASRKGMKLPGSPSAPKWSGDKAYMDMMVQDHTNDLAAFKKEASKGSDPDLKAFASNTAKVVAEHLKMAKQIDSKLK